MVQPTISEVSGVDMPAHLVPGWLVMKGVNPDSANLLAMAEMVAKGMTPDKAAEALKESQMPKLEKAVRDALPADVLEYVEHLEGEVTKAASLPAAPVDEKDAFEKALATMPAEARAFMKAQQKEAAEAKAIAKGLADKAVAAEWLEKAKALPHLPKVEAAAFADTMRKAADGDSDAFGEVYDILKAADSYIEANDKLTKEIGTSQPDQGEAVDQIRAFAEELRKGDPKLSEAEAMTKAAVDHPELYTKHLKEG